MSSTRKEQQPAMRCHFAIEGLGFLGASQAIAVARQDQDRHVVRNSSNRPEWRNLLNVRQKRLCGITRLEPDRRW